MDAVRTRSYSPAIGRRRFCACAAFVKQKKLASSSSSVGTSCQDQSSSSSDRRQSAATVVVCCSRLEILGKFNGNRQHVATARPPPRRSDNRRLRIRALRRPGPRELRLRVQRPADLRVEAARSGRAGRRLLGEISLVGPAPTPHNSFSNPIDGFFAPGGTEVWQADKTFEWLLATAFGPERSSSPP